MLVEQSCYHPLMFVPRYCTRSSSTYCDHGFAAVATPQHCACGTNPPIDVAISPSEPPPKSFATYFRNNDHRVCLSSNERRVYVAVKEFPSHRSYSRAYHVPDKDGRGLSRRQVAVAVQMFHDICVSMA